MFFVLTKMGRHAISYFETTGFGTIWNARWRQTVEITNHRGHSHNILHVVDEGSYDPFIKPSLSKWGHHFHLELLLQLCSEAAKRRKKVSTQAKSLDQTSYGAISSKNSLNGWHCAVMSDFLGFRGRANTIHEQKLVSVRCIQSHITYVVAS